MGVEKSTDASLLLDRNCCCNSKLSNSVVAVKAQLAITLAAGLLAMPIMRYVGKGMLRLHAAIPLQQMIMSVIVFVASLVFVSTGFIGLAVMIVGTMLGLLPPRLGISLSHSMGVILVPITYLLFKNLFDKVGFL